MPFTPQHLQAVRQSDRALARETEPVGLSPEEHAEEEIAEGAPERFALLLGVLEQYAPEVETACGEYPPRVLRTSMVLDDETQAKLAQQLERLPFELMDALRVELQDGITAEDAALLAQHLEREGLIDLTDLVAGWLLRVSDHLVEVGEIEDDAGHLESRDGITASQRRALHRLAFDEMDGRA